MLCLTKAKEKREKRMHQPKCIFARQTNRRMKAKPQHNHELTNMPDWWGYIIFGQGKGHKRVGNEGEIVVESQDTAHARQTATKDSRIGRRSRAVSRRSRAISWASWPGVFWRKKAGIGCELWRIQGEKDKKRKHREPPRSDKKIDPEQPKTEAENPRGLS